MTKTSSTIRLMSTVMATATMFAVFVLVGCSQNAEHAEVKDAVNSALTSNNLGVVTVSQDREKGVITFTGDVESEDRNADSQIRSSQCLICLPLSSRNSIRAGR